MGSIEIFSNITYTHITLWGLVLLFFTSIYCSYHLNITRALWYLFAGLLMEFIGSWYGFHISYSSSEVSINIRVALELTFSLISLVLLAVSASEILTEKAPKGSYVAGGTFFGLITIAILE